MSHVSHGLRGALCAAAFLLAAGPAGAALVPLDTSNPSFSDNELNNGDTATDGSIVLTFGDPLSVGGGDSINVDADGIFLDPIGSVNGVSFSIVFNTDTLIDQYTVGHRNPGATGGFQLAGANGTSGLNDMGSVGTFTFDMGSIPYFAVGQTYTLTHTLNNLSQLKAFNISEYTDPTPAPAPATALLLAGGLLGLRTLQRAPRRD
ncbi:hypothetical protein [uncultured Thiohalocapsa sp.]|uniref:hypothetical protein n=1 Tax=uncultured Thiohalocapsa sp. TaxID=768990 RepID=UPI0025EA157B|nr:hypothetical protein [uncultured Thiohalocapsa sp.]